MKLRCHSATSHGCNHHDHHDHHHHHHHHCCIGFLRISIVPLLAACSCSAVLTEHSLGDRLVAVGNPHLFLLFAVEASELRYGRHVAKTMLKEQKCANRMKLETGCTSLLPGA